MGIKTFFSNSFETLDTNEAEFTTHYYANDYNTSKNAVVSVGKQLGYKMTNVSKLLLKKVLMPILFRLLYFSYNLFNLFISIT